MAECASLERMCSGNGTEGSNPSLSANFDYLLEIVNFMYHGVLFSEKTAENKPSEPDMDNTSEGS